MPIYEDSFLPTVELFKDCLKVDHYKQNRFALDHGIKPSTFAAALNRDGNMNDQIRQAILDYIKGHWLAKAKRDVGK